MSSPSMPLARSRPSSVLPTRSKVGVVRRHGTGNAPMRRAESYGTGPAASRPAQGCLSPAEALATSPHRVVRRLDRPPAVESSGVATKPDFARKCLRSQEKKVSHQSAGQGVPFFAFFLKLPANFSGEQDMQTISPTTQGALFQSQTTSRAGCST
jgi:hypothetical protein